MSGAYRDRLFRPGDIRHILRRAAELQDETKNEGAGGRPQTLGELTRIATEAGISEVALTRALNEDGGAASAPTAKKVSWSWAGGPGRIVIERRIPVEISAHAHTKLVKVMRRASGELGNPQTFGDSLSWATAIRPGGGGRQLSAIVEPADDGSRGTLLRIEDNLGALRGGLFGGVLGGVGGGGMTLVVAFTRIMIGKDAVPVAMLVWFVGIYFAVRALYGSRARAREAQLREMADTLVAELGAGDARSHEGSASTSGENVRVAAPVLAAAIDDTGDEDLAVDESRRASSTTR